MPLPYASGSVNAVLLPGEEAALVDPGPDTEPAREALARACLEANVPIDRLRWIVVTHAHVGHCGLTGWVQSRSGAVVLCHPAAVAPLSDFPASWRARVDLLRRAATAGGFDPATVDAMVERQRALGRLGGSVPAEALRPVREGTRLRFGDDTWSAMLTPGHARDHLCLVHGPSGTLLSGDTLLRRVDTVPWIEDRRPDGSRPAAVDDLLATWRRLSRMPIDTAWPGHGQSIRAPRLLLARRMAALQTQAGAARDFLARGPATLQELALALSLDAAPDGLPSTLSQVVALADHLVANGSALRQVDGGLVRFRAV